MPKPLLPKREPRARLSIKLPESLAKELERIAEREDMPRDELLTHFLSWAIDQYCEGENRKSPQSPPK